MPSLAENLSGVLARIAECEKASGRRTGSVRLLAVSKTFPAADVAEARRCGQVMFGENRVQELETKVPVLPADIEWHLIGHLQSNKAAKAVALARWIHSVDSEKLIGKLAAAANAAQRRPHILLELNLSGEESKSGFRGGIDAVRALVETALRAGSLELNGFMTMAALGAPDDMVRAAFARLREIRDRMETEFRRPFPELSMGMSGDYPLAIAEGATIVRVGTAVFGHRDYPA